MARAYFIEVRIEEDNCPNLTFWEAARCRYDIRDKATASKYHSRITSCCYLYAQVPIYRCCNIVQKLRSGASPFVVTLQDSLYRTPITPSWYSTRGLSSPHKEKKLCDFLLTTPIRTCRCEKRVTLFLGPIRTLDSSPWPVWTRNQPTFKHSQSAESSKGGNEKQRKREGE